jgi:hypothetical protein
MAEPPAVLERTVERVTVRVTYGDGTGRMWTAVQPQNCHVDEVMVTQPTRLGIIHGAGAVTVHRAVPGLRVEFTSHPRHPLAVRDTQPGEPS